MFRGLALVMIFINHVPGTIYEHFTNRNFGFSDAAEAFVFMSGLAAGLAYSSGFRSGSVLAAIAKIWARARQLYFAHLTMTMLSLAIFAAAAYWFGLPEVLTRNNIPSLFQQPLGTIIGIPLMLHQFGYLNILPLYIVLLLATPLIIIAGLRRPYVVLALSILLWALAGQYRLNFPNYPTSGGWFLNPLSWQVLFVVGLLSGMAMKKQEQFVPFSPLLFGLAAAFVVFVLLWMRIPTLAEAGRSMLSLLHDAGLPSYITGFNKSYLALPRLLHALALFYVVSSMASVRVLAGTRAAAPLRLLGRQGLAVFSVGTVLSLFLQAVKTPRMPDPLFDGLCLGTGLLLLLALAWMLTRVAELRASQRQAKTAD